MHEPLEFATALLYKCRDGFSFVNRASTTNRNVRRKT
jgi:hypothetical protein